MKMFSQKKNRLTLLGCSFLSFFMVAAFPLQSAEEPVPSLPEVKETQEAPLSDAKITAFAKAQIAMHRIFMKYQPEMSKPPEDVEGKKTLQNKVIGEMAQALEAQGLTQEEYNAITKQASQDKDLYKRLSKEMVDVQKVPAAVAASAATPAAPAEKPSVS